MFRVLVQKLMKTLMVQSLQNLGFICYVVEMKLPE